MFLSNPRTVTHRDLKLGDCVSLKFTDHDWDCAKVIRVHATTVTFMRPWMNSYDAYPHVGFEIFDVYRDSDKTVTLLSRVE